MKNEFKTHCDPHKGRHVNVQVIVELLNEDVIQRQLEEMVENYNSYYGYADYNDLVDDIRAMVKDNFKVHVEPVSN